MNNRKTNGDWLGEFARFLQKRDAAMMSPVNAPAAEPVGVQITPATQTKPKNRASIQPVTIRVEYNCATA